MGRYEAYRANFQIVINTGKRLNNKRITRKIVHCAGMWLELRRSARSRPPLEALIKGAQCRYQLIVDGSAELQEEVLRTRRLHFLLLAQLKLLIGQRAVVAVEASP